MDFKEKASIIRGDTVFETTGLAVKYLGDSGSIIRVEINGKEIGVTPHKPLRYS